VSMRRSCMVGWMQIFVTGLSSWRKGHSFWVENQWGRILLLLFRRIIGQPCGLVRFAKTKLSFQHKQEIYQHIVCLPPCFVLRWFLFSSSSNEYRWNSDKGDWVICLGQNIPHFNERLFLFDPGQKSPK
jgi:hypothetical protein